MGHTVISLRRSHMFIWCTMMRGYFIIKQPAKAVELFEYMLHSPAGIHYSITDIPPLCPFAYSIIIEGFFSLGDPDAAMRWFDKMLEQEGPAPNKKLTPYSTPGKPGQIAWEALLEGLYARGMVKKFNLYSSTLLRLARQDRCLSLRLLRRFNI